MTTCPGSFLCILKKDKKRSPVFPKRRSDCTRCQAPRDATQSLREKGKNKRNKEDVQFPHLALISRFPLRGSASHLFPARLSIPLTLDLPSSLTPPSGNSLGGVVCLLLLSSSQLTLIPKVSWGGVGMKHWHVPIYNMQDLTASVRSELEFSPTLECSIGFRLSIHSVLSLVPPAWSGASSRVSVTTGSAKNPNMSIKKWSWKQLSLSDMAVCVAAAWL